MRLRAFSTVLCLLLAPLAAKGATPSCCAPAGCCAQGQPRVVVHFVSADGCDPGKREKKHFLRDHCCCDEPPRGEIVEAVGIRRTPAAIQSDVNLEMFSRTMNQPSVKSPPAKLQAAEQECCAASDARIDELKKTLSDLNEKVNQMNAQLKSLEQQLGQN